VPVVAIVSPVFNLPRGISVHDGLRLGVAFDEKREATGNPSRF
jgi:hypothetical protein